MKSMKWKSGFHSSKNAFECIDSVGIHIIGVTRKPICNTDMTIWRKSMKRVQRHANVSDKKNRFIVKILKPNKALL
ncbi:TPA: hypothetical protein ACIAOO_004525, partial [Salmonella enterica subsp. diarizonae serovar 48:k:-]